MRLCALWFLMVLLVGSPASASPSGDDAVAAVRVWYATIRSATGAAVDGVRAGGTVNGPQGYRDAYHAMSPGFRARISEEKFLATFAHTAYIRLRQAILVNASRCAEVFVEDMRDMLLDDLPATVPFYGTVRVCRAAGGWTVDALDLRPELSIISERDAGHGSGGYLADVAMAAVGAYLHRSPNSVRWSDFEHLGIEASSSPVVLRYRDGSHALAVTLARLDSGQYVSLSVIPLGSGEAEAAVQVPSIES